MDLISLIHQYLSPQGLEIIYKIAADYRIMASKALSSLPFLQPPRTHGTLKLLIGSISSSHRREN